MVARQWRILLGVLFALAGSLPVIAADSDPAVAALERQREEAGREVKRARQRVKEATDAVAVAKTRLDAYIAEHLEELSRTKSAETPENSAANQVSNEALTTQLNQQIEELTIERTQLLTRFTTSHPEVVNLDTRIAEISTQLHALSNPQSQRESLPPGEEVDGSSAVANKEAAASKSRQARHREAVEQYQQAFRKWELAQHDLELALAAERAAVDRLAAAAPKPAAERIEPAKTVPQLTAEPETAAVPVAPPKPVVLAEPKSPLAVEDPARMSQQIALAALVIALAIAALAAVKLARTSNDTLFDGIDDIAAALALPVVGVLPSVERGGAVRLSTRMAQGISFIAQLAVAVTIFALVAYAVQNLGAIGSTLAHPIESLQRLGGWLGWR